MDRRLWPLLFVALHAGCGGSGPPPMPTAPTSPTTANPTMTAASGRIVSLNGVWLSGCVFPTAAAPNGSIRESWTISGSSITILIDRFGNETCAGSIHTTERVDLRFSLGRTSTARLGSRVVGVTRVDGIDLGNGQPFKQVFHVDDTAGPERIFHGIFAETGGTTDAEGYPTELFEFFGVRQ